MAAVSFFWDTVETQVWPPRRHVKTLCTVEQPQTATSLQWPLFFRLGGQKNQYIDSCLKPLYNDHLFTTATFFCPQGSHCREIQLYTIQPHTAATFLNKAPIYQDYCFLHPRLNRAIYTRKNKTRLT